MYEIEAKVKVDNHTPIRDYLTSHGAIFTGKRFQKDIYFNAPHRDFASTDEALRIRYQSEGAEITYKGPRIGSAGLKAREEVNVQVDSGEKIEQLLELLGFTRSMEVKKWREEFQWKGASIALDDVEGLGNFIEIEITTPDKEDETPRLIGEVEKALGIEGPHITDSYLELLLATR